MSADHQGLEGRVFGPVSDALAFDRQQRQDSRATYQGEVMQDLFVSSTVISRGAALIVQALLMLPLFSDNKHMQCVLRQLVLLRFASSANVIACAN